MVYRSAELKYVSKYISIERAIQGVIGQLGALKNL